MSEIIISCKSIYLRNVDNFDMVKGLVKQWYKDAGIRYLPRYDTMLNNLLVGLNMAEINNTYFRTTTHNHTAWKTMINIFDTNRVLNYIEGGGGSDYSVMPTVFPSIEINKVLLSFGEDIPFRKTIYPVLINTSEIYDEDTITEKQTWKTYDPVSQNHSLPEMKRYNKFMLKHDIRVDHLNGLLHIPVDPQLTRIFGVFEGSKYQYGRMYGNSSYHAQSYSTRRLVDIGDRHRNETPIREKSLYFRKDIKIDHEDIVEYDYKSLHPNILYNLSGFPCVSDAYNIEGMTSPFDNYMLKIAMLIMIGSGDRASCLSGIRKKVNDDTNVGLTNKDIHSYMSAIEDKHPLIKHNFYCSISNELQRIDSDIMLEILLDGVKQNIPILPIHDSCIVPESKSLYIQELMNTVYKRHLGYDIVVEKVKEK